MRALFLVIAFLSVLSIAPRRAVAQMLVNTASQRTYCDRCRESIEPGEQYNISRDKRNLCFRCGHIESNGDRPLYVPTDFDERCCVCDRHTYGRLKNVAGTNSDGTHRIVCRRCYPGYMKEHPPSPWPTPPAPRPSARPPAPAAQPTPAWWRDPLYPENIFRLAISIAVLALAIAAIRYLTLRAAAARDAPTGTRVFYELAERVRGATATSSSFEGRFRDRTVRIDLHGKGDGRTYAITLDSAIGMPLTAQLSDEAAVDELAQAAVRGAASDPTLQKLALALTSNTNDWRALFRVYRIQQIDFRDGKVHATAPDTSAGLGLSREAERLVAILTRLVDVTTLAGSILAIKARLGVEARCPYCHDSLSEPSRRARSARRSTTPSASRSTGAARSSAARLRRSVSRRRRRARCPRRASRRPDRRGGARTRARP
jgi:hypothetical protein